MIARRRKKRGRSRYIDAQRPTYPALRTGGIWAAVALSLAPEVPNLYFTGPDDRPDIIEAKYVPGVRFEHDAVVLRLRVHGPDPDTEMEMHGELPMEIRFGESVRRRVEGQPLRDVAADVVVQLGTPLGRFPTS